MTEKKRGRERMLTDDQKKDAKEVLRGRTEWTWLTAEEELESIVGKVPAMFIYNLFKECGFNKEARNSPIYRRA